VTTLRRHPVPLAAIAVAVAAAALVAVATAAGWGRIGDALSGFRPGWLALVAGGLLVAFVAYADAYRQTVRCRRGPSLSRGTAARLVLVGFAPQRPLGGFRLDRDALELFGDDEHRITNRVLGLGALEYAVLAPAACVCAIVLLARGGGGVLSGMLWPWALAVPAGFAVAFVLERRRERLAEGGRVRRALARVLEPITLLRALVLERDCRSSWPGMTLYWVGEVAALGGALATVGASLSVWALVVAFATGHAATRRSLPLGGAGATEALLAYGLHWCGVALAPAVVAVAVYRALGYVLPLLPALAVRRSVPVLRQPATS
jgi:hypothetical protein